MTDSAGDEQTATIMPPYLYGVASYCIAAAGLLGLAAAGGVTPGHNVDQLLPFLIHLLLSAISLTALAETVRAGGLLKRSAISSFYVLSFALGLGVVSIFISGSAVFDLNATNAAALLALPPGCLAVLHILFEGKEAPHPGIEAIQDAPSLPSLLIAKILARQSLVYGAFFASLFVAVGAGTQWFSLLHGVLWESAHTDLVQTVGTNLEQVASLWPLCLVPFFIGFVIALLQCSPILGRAWRERKKKLGLVAPLSYGERTAVEDILERLWETANPPSGKKISAAVVIIPILFWLAIGGAGLTCLLNFESVVNWFNPVKHADATWHLLVRDRFGAFFSTVLFGFSMLGPYRLVIDNWPQALKEALTDGLRQGQTFDSSKVRRLRRKLSREARRQRLPSIRNFEPRGFLLSLRKSDSRRIYVASFATFLVAMLIFWRVVETYTYVDNTGFERVEFLAFGKNQYRYRDVASVAIACYPKEVRYEVHFKDNRSAQLMEKKDFPDLLPEMAEVDRRLREAGIPFELSPNETNGAGRFSSCVSDLTAEYGNSSSIMQIMHEL